MSAQRGQEIDISLCSYVLCAWVSLAVFLIFAPSPWNVSTGSSAAIYGILGSQTIFFPDSRLIVFDFFSLKIRIVSLMAGMEFVLTLQGRCGVGARHYFGAIWQLGMLTSLASPGPSMA